MFIGSSVERLELAYAAQEGLEHEAECTVWTQGVFELSRPGLASLIDQLYETDFGLFILAPDDVTSIRDATKRTVRDNVVFELGLFIGRLGSERCFLFAPRGVEDLHLPSDLVGITPAFYEPDRTDGNLVAALGPACNRVRRAVSRLGHVEPSQARTIEVPNSPSQELFTDLGDCDILLRSWLGSRTRSDNLKALHFDQIDRELKLAPGTARDRLEGAAKTFGYEVAQRGATTLLLRVPPVHVSPRRSTTWMG